MHFSIAGAEFAKQREEGRMRHRSRIAIVPRPNGRWAIQMDGTRQAHSVHATKPDALARGRELARKYEAQLVIEDEVGRISEDSEG